MLNIIHLDTEIDGFIESQYMATINGKPVGVIAYHDYEGVPVIMRLFVESNSRNTGIARRLVTELINRAMREGRQFIEVVVAHQNRHLVEFYESFGFTTKETGDIGIGLVKRFAM